MKPRIFVPLKSQGSGSGPYFPANMGRLTTPVLVLSVSLLVVSTSITADGFQRAPSVPALPPVYQLQRARHSPSTTAEKKLRPPAVKETSVAVNRPAKEEAIDYFHQEFPPGFMQGVASFNFGRELNSENGFMNSKPESFPDFRSLSGFDPISDRESTNSKAAGTTTGENPWTGEDYSSQTANPTGSGSVASRVKSINQVISRSSVSNGQRTTELQRPVLKQRGSATNTAAREKQVKQSEELNGFMNSQWNFWPKDKSAGSTVSHSSRSQDQPKERSSVSNPGARDLTLSAALDVADSRNDDEAFLEPDTPPVPQKRSDSKPTDIADIIADSRPSEQRFISSFEPSVGPFGRPFGPVVPPPPVRRRPVPSPSLPAAAARAPYTPPASFDYYDGNNNLGSGNFEVLSGGVFRDAGDYSTDYRNPRPVYHNDNYGFEPFLDDFFNNFRDFADINQDRN